MVARRLKTKIFADLVLSNENVATNNLIIVLDINCRGDVWGIHETLAF